MGEEQRQKGTVKWFNAAKGFGFITPESGGEDLFVHQTSIDAEGFRSLREGEEVEFDIEAGEDGRTKAIKVTGPEGAAPQGAPRRSSYRGGGTIYPGRGRGPPPGRGRAYYGPPAQSYGYGYGGGYGYYGGYPPVGRGRGGRPPRGAYAPRGRGRAYAAGAVQAPPPQAESTGLQVVVHNLPWAYSWQQLKDVFKEWKVERADVVFDRFGRSRGFGTVRFSTKEDADAACTKLNETDIEGRTITVRIDRFA